MPRGPKKQGGARPGAGRPKGSSTAQKIAKLLQVASDGPSPLEFLCAVYRNDEIAMPLRIAAAVNAAKYVHTPLSPQRAVDDDPDGGLFIEVVEFREADFQDNADFYGRPLEREKAQDQAASIAGPGRHRSPS